MASVSIAGLSGERKTGLALNLSKGHCLLPCWPVSTPGGLKTALG
jgi:hypothetical protein